MQLELQFGSPKVPYWNQPCVRCGHAVGAHRWLDAIEQRTNCYVPGTGWAMPCPCLRPVVWSARVRLGGWWTGRRGFVRTQPFDKVHP